MKPRRLLYFLFNNFLLVNFYYMNNILYMTLYFPWWYIKDLGYFL